MAIKVKLLIKSSALQLAFASDNFTKKLVA